MPDLIDALRTPEFAHVSLVLATPDIKRFSLNFKSLPRDGWGQGRVEGMEDEDPQQVEHPIQAEST